MTLNADWHHFYMKLASTYSEKSKDPRCKVGAVLVNPESKSILGWGYNGFARGVVDRKAWLEDKETKKAIILHAELNAVLNTKGDLNNAVCYSTRCPCPLCTSILIQVGVKTFVYPEDSKLDQKDHLCKQQCEDAGVQRIPLPFGEQYSWVALSKGLVAGRSGGLSV